MDTAQNIAKDGKVIRYDEAQMQDSTEHRNTRTEAPQTNTRTTWQLWPTTKVVTNLAPVLTSQAGGSKRSRRTRELPKYITGLLRGVAPPVDY